MEVSVPAAFAVPTTASETRLITLTAKVYEVEAAAEVKVYEVDELLAIRLLLART